MCQKTPLLHRLFVVLHKPTENKVVPYVMSIQPPFPATRAIYEIANKEDRYLTKREIETFCLLPNVGPRYNVVEVSFTDEWLRSSRGSSGSGRMA